MEVGATRAWVLLVWLVSSLAGAELGEKIHQLLESSPVARQAFWGIQIVDLQSGKTLFELHPNHPFVPASNTKLFTTALGLMRLGPDYRFHTTVVAEQPPDSAGRVRSLRLVGGGDPNLSARGIPYRMGPVSGNPLQAIEDLAGQVVARGVGRVDGDVVGDDSAYVWTPYPEGWAIDDLLWEYGAPVSALSVNDNAFSLTVQPGNREGELAKIGLWPRLEYYEIDNRIRTSVGAERKISIDREPGSRQLRLWGTIPLQDKGETQLLGIDDPALYAASALYDALRRRGVAIAGRPVAKHPFANQAPSLEKAPPAGPAAGVELARRASAPLVEDLRVTDKVSQNLHAELVLRAVGKARRNIGSREAGLEEMKTFLDEVGIGRGAYSLHDGSGLSRLNLVTAAAVVKLLRYMYGSPARESWLSLLPVGGVDGTLSTRFGDSAAAGRIRAKTGTLSHVSALSGYAEPKEGTVRAFSILVNNYNGPPSEVRGVIDRICMSAME